MVENILVIDDELMICEAISSYLKKHGFNVFTANTGNDGLRILKEQEISFIILDLMLPDMSGEEICSIVRSQSRVPIIMLTAKTMEEDMINGLSIGADDYITKPFEIREVLARVHVQLRHKEEKEAEEQHALSFKDMILNRDTFQVEIAGKILPKITKQEFAILELLLRNPKQVFSKEDIFEYAWDEPYMGETKTLDVHISNIRKKLKEVTAEEYIETVWGIGYRLHE